MTCICKSADLTSAVSSCAYSACSTIPELLELQKYSAVSCGVESDKTRLKDVLKMDYIVPFLTACFIGGRVVARVLLDVGLGADDWMILAAAAAYFVDGRCFSGHLCLNSDVSSYSLLSFLYALLIRSLSSWHFVGLSVKWLWPTYLLAEY